MSNYDNNKGNNPNEYNNHKEHLFVQEGNKKEIEENNNYNNHDDINIKVNEKIK